MDGCDTQLARENARLEALSNYDLLDTPPEEGFDDLTRLAAQICGAPIAIVSLVASRRQWFKSKVGIDLCETPREIAFCQYALRAPDLFLVPDTLLDPRFINNPLVTGPPFVRAYAGAPLVTPDGHILGTMCVMHTQPLTLSKEQKTALQSLSRQVVAQMELRRRLADLERAEAVSHMAEQALRDTLEQMQLVTDNIPALVARIDSGYRYVFSNLAYQQISGLRPADMIGRTVSEVLGEAAFTKLRPIYDQVFAGKSLTREIELPFPAGPRFMHVSYAPERNPSGAVTGLTLSAIDITARKQAEEGVRQAEEKYRGIFENAVEGIFQSIPGGGFLGANQALARMLGYAAPTELLAAIHNLGTQVYANPAERATMQHLFETCGFLSNHELQVFRKDGTTFWASLSARAVCDEATGDILYIEGSAIDVTARREAEQALRESETRFQSAFHNAPTGMGLMDSSGKYLQINHNLCKLVGYSEAELIASGLAAITHPDDVNADLRQYERMIDGNFDAYAMEKRYYHRSGHVVWAHLNVSVVRDAARRPLHVIVHVLDITEWKGMEAERERLLQEALERADRDPLTSLLNHRAFHKRLDEECEHAEGTTCGPVAVVMMDLDNFKFFNDSYGHPAGDDVLRRVAEVLSACARPTDTVARFGGDEFALILPGLDLEGAAELVRSMCDRMEGAGYCPEGTDIAIPLALSAGIAVWPHDHAARLEVVEHADERLRRNKTGADDLCADDLRTHMGRSLEGFSMLDALVTAVDNKDRYTRRHSEDVLAYSFQIADELGMDEKMRRTIAVAALLHDVGKIGVPDKILRKPGKLTEDEFKAVQNHPMMGAIIVGAIPGLEDTLDAVRHHHERWDGGGYPFGLSGEETPLIARLMAVADAFSAMTTDRPYRKGMPHERALAILTDGAGTQWDPTCVQAFLRAQVPALALAA